MSRSEKQLNQGGYFCEYGYWHSYTPNAETIAAIEEAEQLLNDPNAKRYATYAELVAEIEAEIDEEEANRDIMTLMAY